MTSYHVWFDGQLLLTRSGSSVAATTRSDEFLPKIIRLAIAASLVAYYILTT